MKKLLNMLFGNIVPEQDFDIVNIDDVLTQEQKNKAISYYNDHKNHIDKIVSNTVKFYEPSETEDKNNPMIWKSEYWKWFLKAQLK